jgi:hypothetical protein
MRKKEAIKPVFPVIPFKKLITRIIIPISIIKRPAFLIISFSITEDLSANINK